MHCYKHAIRHLRNMHPFCGSGPVWKAHHMLCVHRPRVGSSDLPAGERDNRHGCLLVHTRLWEVEGLLNLHGCVGSQLDVPADGAH